MYTEQIERGVEWLNENYPGWVNKIDLKQLEMVNCFSCVLGQLYRDFFDAPTEVSGFNIDAKYGFNISTEEHWDNYDILTQEWKDKIVELRSKIG